MIKKDPLSSYSHLFFIGIGGIGMSALARYFRCQNKTVAGYDRTPSALTDQLQQEGMGINFTDKVVDIDTSMYTPDRTLVVYTPAIPQKHQQLNFFLTNGYTVKKRAEVLGLISEKHFTIAIAGTHGKTTTSSMAAHIIKTSQHPLLAFLGGIDQNSATNMIFEENAQLMLTEADEFDKSFLTLQPNIALVSSIDADHLDIYGSSSGIETSYRDFVHRITENGWLITKPELSSFFNHPQTLTYGESEGDFHATAVQVKDGSYRFQLSHPKGVLSDCSLNIGGRHNLENAIGAAAVALAAGVSEKIVRTALASYKGVKRRFEVHYQSDNMVYIDDYAHHPSEINACIAAVRELYPSKKLTCIFQPHLFSRTRDFMEGFASSLAKSDQLILLPIYPAREEPIEGVSSSVLLERITIHHKQLLPKEKVVDFVSKLKEGVLLTIGAGDIDRFVQPITNHLNQRT
jgi:UDP-N-acetylmuramate--alanine ligase